MAEWVKGKLGDYAEVKGGKRLPKGTSLISMPNSHPYIRIRDLGKEKYLNLNDEYEYVDDETQATISRYIVRTGDVVLSIVGTIGLLGIVGDSLDSANLTENCVKIVNAHRLDMEYIYYYLLSEFGQTEIAKATVGAVQPKLPIKNIQDLTIRFPTIEVQQRIVRILSAFDSKIAENRRISNNLEQQALTIFDEMFPNTSSGNNCIGDIIIPKRGNALLSKNAIFGKVPVVAGGLEPATYHNTSNTQAPVLSISASGANAGYVSLWTTPIWSSDSSFIDSSMTDNVYFWYVLLKRRQKEIYDAQTGSAQPHIYPQHIAAMPLAEIGAEKIGNYTDIVTPLFETIGHNTAENLILAELRNALLPKLMSGEFDVSDLDL